MTFARQANALAGSALRHEKNLVSSLRRRQATGGAEPQTDHPSGHSSRLLKFVGDSFRFSDPDRAANTWSIKSKKAARLSDMKLAFYLPCYWPDTRYPVHQLYDEMVEQAV